jgi:general secretion pathway protein E
MSRKESTSAIGSGTGENSASDILEQLVARAAQASASDIHLQMTGKSAQVAFRLDGVMTPAMDLPESVAERVFGRIKFLARLKTYQESLPQDGRIDKSALNSQNDVRVATYPAVVGEKIVLRLFHMENARSLRELSLPDRACDELERFLRQSSGLLLLTGPAGSGKTTTIYACLRFLSALGGRHVITVEDPAEQIIPGIMQTEINEPRGLTFPVAARHLLRQDPQALVIGEIRDEETANIAVRSALTGHLVISTLHAGSCQGVLERLQVMCSDHSAVAAAVDLLFNQRLIRRLCRDCQGAGCDACLRTGYHGRVPLVEWLKITDSSRPAIRRQEFHSLAPQQPLDASAKDLLRQGITNDAEYRRIFGL